MAIDAARAKHLLRKCQSISQLKQIHAHLILCPHVWSLPNFTRILQLYINSGEAYHEHATHIFRQVLRPTLDVYNVIVRVFSGSRDPPKAILFFKEMVGGGIKPDSLTCPFVLKSCSRAFAVKEGFQIHGFVAKSGFCNDGFVHNTLMNMYSVNGEVGCCEKLFESCGFRDTVSWNTLMLSYARNNRPLDAFKLFRTMMEDGNSCPNQITMVTLLGVCSQLRELDLGKSVHGVIELKGFKYNLFLETALVDMYSKCGKTEIARQVFDRMSERNTVSWNAMISGYAQNGMPENALDLFCGMEACRLKPNDVTMLAIVSSCTQLQDLKLGSRALDYIKERKIRSMNLQNAIVDMYAKCGDMESAKRFFDGMQEKDQVSWTSLVEGYVRSCRFKEAIESFQQMQSSNLKPDAASLVSLLKLCSRMGSLDLGRWIHVYVERNKVSDLCLSTALIDMYCKCGVVTDAMKVFNRMPSKNALSWTSMISGLGMNGCFLLALEIFTEMQRESMVRPDAITFVAVLSACSHAGLVDKGYHYFNMMTKYYGIEPTVEHYGCMVDLLGRAGLVREAREMVEKMPMKPSAASLGSLLSSCRIHGELHMAKEIVKYVVDIEDRGSAAYVAISNVYADAMMWEDVGRVREVMKMAEIRKTPGGSMIDLRNGAQEFLW